MGGVMHHPESSKGEHLFSLISSQVRPSMPFLNMQSCGYACFFFFIIYNDDQRPMMLHSRKCLCRTFTQKSWLLWDHFICIRYEACCFHTWGDEQTHYAPLHSRTQCAPTYCHTRSRHWPKTSHVIKLNVTVMVTTLFVWHSGQLRLWCEGWKIVHYWENIAYLQCQWQVLL